MLRDRTMSLVSNNIKYLRRLHNLTQEQFSRRIGIKRSLVGAYEEARANPNLENLMVIGRTFGVSVDSLLKHDLRRIRDTPDLSLPLDDNSPPPPPPLLPRDTPDPSPLSAVIDKYYREENFYGGNEKKTLSIEEEFADDPFFEPKKSTLAEPVDRAAQRILPKPIDPNVQVTFNGVAVQMPTPPKSQIEPYTFNNAYEAEVKEPPKNSAKAEPLPSPAVYQVVQLVQHTQFDEYLEKYQQGEFVSKLPTFQLPMLPAGNYRAFEANGDFEFKKAYLIGQFVKNWYEINDALHYFLVVRGRGFLYRRVYNQVKIKGVLLLTSDNPNVGSFEVSIKDVLEVWEIKSFISATLPQPAASFERIRQLVDELHHELDRFKKE